MWSKTSTFDVASAPNNPVFIDAVERTAVVVDRGYRRLHTYSLDTGELTRSVDLPFEEIAWVGGTRDYYLILRNAWDFVYTARVDRAGKDLEENIAHGLGSDDCYVLSADVQRDWYVILVDNIVSVFNHVTGTLLAEINTLVRLSAALSAHPVLDDEGGVKVVATHFDDGKLYFNQYVVLPAPDATQDNTPAKTFDKPFTHPLTIMVLDATHSYLVLDRVEGLVEVSQDGTERHTRVAFANSEGARLTFRNLFVVDGGTVAVVVENDTHVSLFSRSTTA